MIGIPIIGGPLDGNAFTSGGNRRACPLGHTFIEFQGMPFIVHDEMGFLAARREMRRRYARANDRFGYAEESALRSIEQRAKDLVEDCCRGGVVLTITQRPLQPLGMAHYETVVEVRPVQVPT